MATPPPRLLSVGLLGSTGRMGTWVQQLAKTDYASKLSLNMAVSSKDDLIPLLKAEVVIDFSSPEGLCRLIRPAIVQTGNLPIFVVGSTGWTPDQTDLLRALSKKTQVLIASNFGIGVLAFMEIVRASAPLFARLGYEPVLIETHHKNKKDAPSGTALALMKAVQKTAPQMPLQIQSIRAGEVIGDHDLTYFGGGDRIQIRHSAQDRSIFARGALDVALWLAKNRARFPAKGEIIGIDAYLQDLLK